jgi:hypothetical protein
MKYETSDLNLAVTLHCLGKKILGVRQVDDKRKNFIFEHDDTIETAVEGFWQDEVRVSPLQFLASQRLLKSMLYS